MLFFLIAMRMFGFIFLNPILGRRNIPAIAKTGLALVLAVISSYKDVPVADKTIVFGEVGLSGEVRAVSMAKQRVQEAKRLGFTKVILPKSSMDQVKDIKGIELIGVSAVWDAMKCL